ncbi:hypothetical protein ACVPBL_005399, partial [Escherichia coli]
RSSRCSHAQYSAPPCCDAPGRRKLAYARANCGILRRKSAESWPAGLLGFAGRRDGLCALVRSAAAAPRFGAMWLCCSLVFSFAPSMPCRASCKHNLTICI